MVVIQPKIKKLFRIFIDIKQKNYTKLVRDRIPGVVKKLEKSLVLT